MMILSNRHSTMSCKVHFGKVKFTALFYGRLWSSSIVLSFSLLFVNRP